MAARAHDSDRRRPSGARPKRSRRVSALSMARGGAGDVERIGLKSTGWRDSYHFLMTIPMPGLLGALISVYLLANAGFALLYLIFPGSIANARPGSFADAYFFSVQTMATIGYGALLPGDLAGNLIATGETVFGMLAVALSAGIVFARVSRPTARMMFSEVAVIGPRNGVPTLMFRVANRRRNQIVEAQISVAVLRRERTAEGEELRRFHDLKLERNRTPIFALSWTVLHVIDQESPLAGATRETLLADDVEILCSITGIDETFAQPVHARFGYGVGDIRWNTRFADIMRRHDDGTRAVDYTHFHDTID
jgi:inward rectifier potassium channel